MNTETTSSDYQRLANRVGAELVEQLGVPPDYEDAVGLAAIAYLQGCQDELKWAKRRLMGEGEA